MLCCLKGEGVGCLRPLQISRLCIPCAASVSLTNETLGAVGTRANQKIAAGWRAAPAANRWMFTEVRVGAGSKRGRHDEAWGFQLLWKYWMLIHAYFSALHLLPHCNIHIHYDASHPFLLHFSSPFISLCSLPPSSPLLPFCEQSPTQPLRLSKHNLLYISAAEVEEEAGVEGVEREDGGGKCSSASETFTTPVRVLYGEERAAQVKRGK